MSITDLVALPPTSNLALQGPYRLTLQEFQALPVSPETLRARATIYELQDCLSQFGDSVRIDEDTLTPIHRFSKGIYTRELTMPAGTIIVGKRHAQEHLVVMSEGFCTVFTERGQEDLRAPCTFISPAGEKRALVIHERTTWITIHRTDATDLTAIEAGLIIPEPLLSLNREQASGVIE
jgi:hypothetical protein